MCFMCFIVNKRVVLIYLDCEQSVNDYLQSDEKNPVIPKRWRNQELQPRACWNGMTACTWIYYLHPSNKTCVNANLMGKKTYIWNIGKYKTFKKRNASIAKAASILLIISTLQVPHFIEILTEESYCLSRKYDCSLPSRLCIACLCRQSF